MPWFAGLSSAAIGSVLAVSITAVSTMRGEPPRRTQVMAPMPTKTLDKDETRHTETAPFDPSSDEPNVQRALTSVSASSEANLPLLPLAEPVKSPLTITRMPASRPAGIKTSRHHAIVNPPRPSQSKKHSSRDHVRQAPAAAVAETPWSRLKAVLNVNSPDPRQPGRSSHR
jgi:hypothetical protein